jgi:hypothetical protein
VSYAATVSASTALDLTMRSVSMLVSPDGAAALSACPEAVDALEEDANGSGWQDWRMTVEHWRPVMSTVSDDTDGVTVMFMGRVNSAENDYIKLVFRPDASDRTQWSFKCWYEGRIFFTS